MWAPRNGGGFRRKEEILSRLPRPRSEKRDYEKSPEGERDEGSRALHRQVRSEGTIYGGGKPRHQKKKTGKRF